MHPTAVKILGVSDSHCVLHAEQHLKKDLLVVKNVGSEGCRAACV